LRVGVDGLLRLGTEVLHHCDSPLQKVTQLLHHPSAPSQRVLAIVTISPTTSASWWFRSRSGR
jgi:hypothetical protein